MSRKRVAVIVIHGIGEQRPMQTIRGFVKSLIGTIQARFYNKPDEFSESFELRTLAVYTTKRGPRTDFFEYYWADNLRGTKLGQILTWLWKLLVRIPSKVPSRIFWLYLLFWLMLAILVTCLLTGVIRIDLLKSSGEYGVVGALVYLLVNGIGFFLIRYLGDAARYTNASPDNIQERQNIRSNGIRLLKKIHDSKKYDQIVMVGHSLGSIIGYDLITNLWDEYNTAHGKPLTFKQDALEKFEANFSLANPDKPFSSFDIIKYQNAQHELWKEQRQLGFPWLITDFITLGSPLTYFDLLIAKDFDELQSRKVEREFPASPPIAEKPGTLSYPLSYEVNETHRTIRVLHHAAPFACTRWHNGYYNSDFVGGSLTRVLGQGIQEKPFNAPGIGRLPFIPHTWYWDETKQHENSQDEPLQWIRNIIFQ